MLLRDNLAKSRKLKPLHGIQKPSSPSATPWPRYAAKSGAIRFLSCHGRARTLSKFHAISWPALKMRSLTPLKSAKVKGTSPNNWNRSWGFRRVRGTRKWIAGWSPIRERLARRGRKKLRVCGNDWAILSRGGRMFHSQITFTTSSKPKQLLSATLRSLAHISGVTAKRFRSYEGL